MSAGRQCMYCPGTAFEPLYEHVRDRLGHVEGERAFVRCTGCGSALLHPMPLVEELPGFYPPVYTFTPDLAKAGTFKRLLASIEYRLFFKNAYAAQVRMVEKNAGGKSNKGKLLDVGCGRGLRLLEFQRAGYEVWGMDFTPESVKYLNDVLHISAVCTDADGLATAFPPETFDTVTAFYVLEHVLDIQITIKHCLKLLKPGGWLVGAVPLIDSTQAKIFGARSPNVTEAPRHISIPTQTALKDVFAACGYRKDTFTIRSDSVLACAGIAGLSMFPSGSSTAVYGGGRIKALAMRACGALGAAAMVPWTLVDNYILHRPTLGIVFAQKPD